jgi:hypothetical protein
MRFQNAILAFATLSSFGVADAKIWTLRGLGHNNNNNNNHEVVVSSFDHSSSSESVLVDELPTPSANLRELFVDSHQRKLPNKVKPDGEKTAPAATEGTTTTKATEATTTTTKPLKGKEQDAAPAAAEGTTTTKKGGEVSGAQAPAAAEGTTTTKKSGDDGEKKKGKMDQKIGDAVLAEAPEDVKEKAGCDEPAEEDGASRRFLKKGGKTEEFAKGAETSTETKGSKADKEALSAGKCDASITSEPLAADDIEASSLPAEAPYDNVCDPTKDTCDVVEKGGVGVDPTTLANYTSPEPEEEAGAVGVDPSTVANYTLPEGSGEGVVDGEIELNEDEATSRRRLTGNTNGIGQFARLACNPVEFDCTGAAGLSSKLGGASAPVVVPCGTCLVVSALHPCYYDLLKEEFVNMLFNFLFDFTN